MEKNSIRSTFMHLSYGFLQYWKKNSIRIENFPFCGADLNGMPKLPFLQNVPIFNFFRLYWYFDLTDYWSSVTIENSALQINILWKPIYLIGKKKSTKGD